MDYESKPFKRLYVHVPFCASKCAYCAFYSEPNPPKELVALFFARLEEELIAGAERSEPLLSAYIGGGTPTWLEPEQLDALFEMIKKRFAFAPEAEISIECNPETLTPEKAGVIANHATRVSLGVQSFRDIYRRRLGRVGNPNAIFPAIEWLAGKGVRELSIDLIYAIPGQTLDDWEQELNTAVSLPINHMSAYSLTFEEGTRLTDSGVKPADEDLEVEMWELIPRILGTRGSRRYEVSNYAVPGFECQHNLGVWFGDPYLGAGPAASSFDGRARWTRIADIRSWLNNAPAAIERLPLDKLARELFIMGLRTSRGWEERAFERVANASLETFEPELSSLIDMGLLTRREGRVAPTTKGLLFWDEIGMSLI